ncbi:carbohydrate ABC transporter permease [Cuneatibacter caecimuris]|uniref:Multiple sugar transport system permease protein n=1 Tax=Cuneatibacter caecimuris TaxID=1796618 RepID=A0A4Q7PN75_9FIRM|nr:sugar ABC transporter permease [Cuneatibacter caecimuris]RZT02382.1 multiple sugar transport system permease protein [Cuneatibacter caecimuris]
MSAETKPAKQKDIRIKRHWYDNEGLAGYIFIGPWLLGFMLFMLIPILLSIYFAFAKYDLLSPPEWAGLQNFINLFTKDRLFYQALKVTFSFALISVPLRLIFALFVAMILNRKSKMIAFYRAAYYLPSIIGGSVAVSVLWRTIWSQDGVINGILGLFGIESTISYIGDIHWAFWTIVILYVWQFGSSMLIFLSGLKQIPTTYYEAATMDGAGKMRCFFKITLPMLSPVILFNLVMQIINGFMVFTQAQIITQGGPNNRTLMYVLYLYNSSFKYNKFGYAAAQAWILLAIVGFFTAIIFITSKSWVFSEADDGDKPKKKKKKGVKAA